jgi:hypothetical protein
VTIINEELWNIIMRILITSNIHLGLDQPQGPLPKQARITTIKKIMALAKSHDLLLIAGDLIQRGTEDREIMKLLYNELSALKEQNVETVLTPGFGEMGSNNELRNDILDLPFTRVFSDHSTVNTYTLMKKPQLLTIYGVPAAANEDFSRLEKTSEKGFHLGLFYAKFDPIGNSASSDIPVINRSTIKRLNLDFYALGYSHHFKMFKVHNRIIGAYAGSPEAASPSETGDRYVISLTIEKNAIKNIKRLSVNTYSIDEKEVDCGTYSSTEELRNAIIELSSKKSCCKLTLKGLCDYHPGKDDFTDLKDYFYSLETVLDYSTSLKALIAEYGKEHSLRGDFFQILRSMNEDRVIPSDVHEDYLTRVLTRIIVKGSGALEEEL